MEKQLCICSAPVSETSLTVLSPTVAAPCTVRLRAKRLHAAAAQFPGSVAYTGGMLLLLPRFAALISAAALLANSGPAAGATKDRRFTSAKLGVTVDAPSGWTMSLHTGYPNIIAVLLHPSGGRISVAVSQTTARSSLELADQNRRGLEAQGLSVGASINSGAGGITLEAQSRTRDEAVRQYYLVRETTPTRQALVATLTTRKDLLASMGPSLDFVVSHLALESPQSDSQSNPSPIRTQDPKRDGSSD
jgi:hypothetical protein